MRPLLLSSISQRPHWMGDIQLLLLDMGGRHILGKLRRSSWEFCTEEGWRANLRNHAGTNNRARLSSASFHVTVPTSKKLQLVARFFSMHEVDRNQADQDQDSFFYHSAQTCFKIDSNPVSDPARLGEEGNAIYSISTRYQ
jgi:hypothetical protein